MGPMSSPVLTSYNSHDTAISHRLRSACMLRLVTDWRNWSSKRRCYAVKCIDYQKEDKM